MAKKKRDLMADHQEWIDHQYNKGYWINRISWANIGQWRFMSRYNRAIGGLGMLGSGIFIGAFLMTLPYRMVQLQAEYEKYSDFPGLGMSPPSYLSELTTLIPFILIFVFSLILAIQKSDPSIQRKDQPEQKKEKKKKLPRRRKDYR